jgi:hypothetical protein
MKLLTTAIEALRKIQGRKRAYQLTMHQPTGQIVLADLAQFCYAYETTFDEDPRIDARKQGRRDVWLRIQQHLKLTDEQLYEIATGGIIPPMEIEQ